MGVNISSRVQPWQRRLASKLYTSCLSAIRVYVQHNDRANSAISTCVQRRICGGNIVPAILILYIRSNKQHRMGYSALILLFIQSNKQTEASLWMTFKLQSESAAVRSVHQWNQYKIENIEILSLDFYISHPVW